MFTLSERNRQVMSVSALAETYLNRPFPIWDENVTQALVDDRWQILARSGQWTPRNYNAAGYYLNDLSVSPVKTKISSDSRDQNIYIEVPCPDCLDGFYIKAGLHPYPDAQINNPFILTCFQEALQLLEYVVPSAMCIHALVRSIIVLVPDNPDTDISYSHPAIPFSIFISCSAQPSNYQEIRLLEAILHEAMHLQLSLTERYIPLIESSRETDLYYSPWRNENRPARGVLHGLFVFRAIYEFFSILLAHPQSTSIKFYTNRRLEHIAHEIRSLTGFPSSDALTATGSLFAEQLTVI